MADRPRRSAIPLWRQRPWQIAAGAFAIAIAATAVGFALTGSGDGGDTAGAAPKRRPATTEGATTTTEAPPPIAPLTGLPDPSLVTLIRPALTAKIGNNPEARPQAGLEQADVVVEEEVEGRITRFLAVFHSQTPERFGPIRSVRRVDPDIVWPLAGLFAYSGGTPPNVAAIRAAPVQSFDESEAGDAMFLDYDHATGSRPNILFGRPEAFWSRADDRTPPAPLFTFLGRRARFGGLPAGQVTIPVGSDGFHPTWTWDPAEEVWRRSYGDAPHVAKSGEQITTDTLVVFFVPGGGAETNVLGEGDAAVFAEGRVVPARWVRPDREQPARILDADGEEVALPPGRIWIHLPMAGGDLEIVPGA